MTTVRRDTDVPPGIYPGLVDYLDEHGLRYEVIDGSIVVSPSPGFSHGDVLGELFVRLRVAAPAELVVVADYGFVYDQPSYVIPDVLVARREDCEETGLHVAPLLAVEVLSKSTRRRDLTRKREIYAEAGVPSYWIVDPQEPALTVLTLTADGYVETARISGDEVLRVEHPFPVDVALTR